MIRVLELAVYMAEMKNLSKQNKSWHDIDWEEIYRYVSNLQTQLAVAWKNNDIVEAFRLQEILINSWKLRALAVRIVTTNPGGKTPGVDNVV